MARLRKIRRRLLPFFPSGAQTRHYRNRFFRRLGLARSHEPFLLVDRPELRVTSLLPYVAADYLVRHGELTFLQIGAFDGVADDDLRTVIDHYECRGVLVEPQPGAFEKLQKTYRDYPHVTLLNAAIDRVSGTRDFYMPSSRSSVVSSFDRAHLIKHGVPAEDIVVEKLPCLTVSDALKKGGLERVDLLQIDAEGYDYEILKSIDYRRLKPAIVRFEFAHFSRRDLDNCLQMLSGHGYRFLTEWKDVIAVREEEDRGRQVGEKTQAAA
jgi:FkbM family methyltransferase